MIKWIGKKLKDDNRGFTLIELVVVIAILAILAAIAIPRYQASRKRAAISAHNANVRTIEGAANMYIADNEDSDVTSEEINGGDSDPLKDYLQDPPVVPKGTGDSNVEEKEGEFYTVEITDGEITVIPEKVSDEPGSEES
ncbi:MAG: prepilin-type N-terminal cleavage/methylation domain-containing protein [Tissierellia bacterium]|nr:prepilin-type N-terminal cleavage/methylation domain-containing protein [Tissierellia bacterium]